VYLRSPRGFMHAVGMVTLKLPLSHQPIASPIAIAMTMMTSTADCTLVADLSKRKSAAFTYSRNATRH